MEEQTPQTEPSIFERMRNRLTPEGVPSDDRGPPSGVSLFRIRSKIEGSV